MINKRKKLGIPYQARRKMITPEIREKVFREIVATYQSKYGLKCMYAFLNTDTELIADYAAVFSVRNDMDTMDLVVYLIPPAYTDLSTPGYRYCRANKIAAKWYQYGIDNMITLSKANFYGFIIQTLKLSLDKNSPAYWKRPENYFVVLTGLLDLSHLYNKDPRANSTGR